MAFPRLKFTKLWTNPTDFPTIQTDENQVRADMQALHDETLSGLNKLAESLEAEGAGANIGVTMPYITGSTDKGTVQQAIDALGRSIQMGGAVPGGGAAGQVLSKASGADNDLKWQDPIPAYLSEGSILSNHTKEMFGLSNSAVADNVFSFVGKYNQHWWSRTKNEPFYSVGESRTLIIQSASNNGVERTVSYSKEIRVNPATGAVELINPSTIQVYYGRFETAQAKTLLGQYVTNVEDGGTWYIDEDATYDSYKPWSDTYRCRIVSGAHLVTGYLGGSIEYVTSSDRNAYPDSGESDGFKWEYLGIPFNNAVTAPKVEVISYVGTGTYGADNPVNLNFSFPVKLLIYGGSKYTHSDGRKLFEHYFSSNDAVDQYVYGVIPAWYTEYTDRCGFGRELNHPPVGKRSEDGKSVSWYQSEDAEYMCNQSGREYFFVAIG